MAIPISGLHVSAESIGDIEKKINDLEEEQSGLNEEKAIWKATEKIRKKN